MNRIKEVLKEKGIKQTWLANRMQKSYNTVNSYVQNRRQPSLADLYQIAELLEVEARDLLCSSLHQQGNNVISNEMIKIPLLGIIACGTPILAEENIRIRIPVSVKILKPNQRYFLLRALGDSMNNAGINDGDLVLIRQQQTAENGDKVVALIDNEATIKEFHHKGNAIVLKPKSTNDKHQPIILSNDFKIQGVVEKVIAL